MARNNKIALLQAMFRRTWPEGVAAAVLIGLLHNAPATVRGYSRRAFRELPVLWAEGSYRIPPSSAHALKGSYPVIQWINAHVPANEPLFYVGGMSTGICLRYYTFPREGNWNYIYRMADGAKLPSMLESYPPAIVVMEDLPAFNDFTLPHTWHEVWQSPAGKLKIYEVMKHAVK